MVPNGASELGATRLRKKTFREKEMQNQIFFRRRSPTNHVE